MATYQHGYTIIISLWLRQNKATKSRAIAGRIARCRRNFRYVSNFTTASYVQFPCHSMAFLLVFVCRLQWVIICQKVIST